MISQYISRSFCFLRKLAVQMHDRVKCSFKRKYSIGFSFPKSDLAMTLHSFSGKMLQICKYATLGHTACNCLVVIGLCNWLCSSQLHLGGITLATVIVIVGNSPEECLEVKKKIGCLIKPISINTPVVGHSVVLYVYSRCLISNT